MAQWKRNKKKHTGNLAGRKRYRPRAIPKHERKRKKRVSPKTTALTTRFQAPTVPEAIEKVLIGGDLNPLSPEQRIEYMKAVCKSLGLNPLTQPFSYILFKETDNAPAKLVLYARKDCAEQLRKIHGVSVIPGMTKRTMDDDFATVEVSVRDRWGKTDTATGMVYLWKKYEGKQYRLSGQRLADAVLKCETKAKRRATLSVCGLGILDEHDLDSLRVVGGVTPEGRTFEYVDTAQAKEAAHTILQEKLAGKRPLHAEEASQEPVEPKKEPPKGKEPSDAFAPMPDRQTRENAANTSLPQLTLDWQVSEVSPRLIGDADIIEKLKGDIHASWGKDQFWYVEARDAEPLRRLQGEYGYKLVEILPKQDSSSGASAPRGTTPSPGGDKHGKRSGSSGGGASASGPSDQPAPAVEFVTGTVEDYHEKTSPVKKTPFLSVLVKGERGQVWYDCWSKTVWQLIYDAKRARDKGLDSVLIIERGKGAPSIKGFRRIGKQEYDEDGRTPVIQQSTREAGQRTIWP